MHSSPLREIFAQLHIQAISKEQSLPKEDQQEVNDQRQEPEMWKSPIWYNTTGKSVLEVQESAKKTNEKRKKTVKRSARHVTYGSRDQQRRRRIAPAAAYPAASAAAL